MRGRGSVERLFHFMQTMDVQSINKGRANADHLYFARPFMNPYALSRQQGMTWVFSDFLAEQGVEEALSYLISAKQEVVVVQVLHPQELEPKLVGDLRLIDSELSDGKDVAISSRVLRDYQEVIAEYTDGLKQYCHERGLTYIRARTDTPLQDMVLQVMRYTGLVQ